MTDQQSRFSEDDITSAFLDYITSCGDETVLFHPTPHRWWRGETQGVLTPHWWALSNMSYRSDVDFFADEGDALSVESALEFVCNDGQGRGIPSAELVEFTERVRAMIPERHVEYRALLTLFVFLIEDQPFARFDEVRAAGEEVLGGVPSDLEDYDDDRLWQARMWLKREAYLLSRFCRGERWNRFRELLDMPSECLPETMLMAMAQAAVKMRRHSDAADLDRRQHTCSRLGRRLVAVAQARAMGRDSYHAFNEFEAAIEVFEAIHDDDGARSVWLTYIDHVGRFREHCLGDTELLDLAVSAQHKLCDLLDDLRSRRYSDSGWCTEKLLLAHETRRRLTVESMERAQRSETTLTIPSHEVDAFHDLIRAQGSGVSRLRGLARSLTSRHTEDLEERGRRLLEGSLLGVFTRQIVDHDGRLLREVSPSQVQEGGDTDETDEPDALALVEGVRVLREQVTTWVNVFIASSLERLIEEELVTAQDAVDAMREAGLVDVRTEALVKVGVEHLFAGDDIAALHILTPRFEDALRSFYDRVTLRGVRQRRGREELATLGAMLEGKLALGSLPGHPSEWRHMVTIWRYLLVQEGVGHNLRNDVCHGLWRNLENPRCDAVIVLMFLLQLTFLDGDDVAVARDEDDASSEEE